MNSAWLAEFHRQWQRARGSRLREMVTAFSRDWGQLLRDAGVESAEDIRHSIREAETLAATGQVKLQRYRNRFIRRIQLPVTQEPWLRAQFTSEAPRKLVGNSLAEVEKAKHKQHPLLRDLWTILCQHLATAFSAGRTLRPFHWRQPEAVQALLSLLYDLTSREWPPYTLVRDACVVLGRETKAIERHQAALESALTLLFGRPMSLEGLGIITSNSRLLFDGPLSLEFADGSRHEAGNLRHGDFITAAASAAALLGSGSGRLGHIAAQGKLTQTDLLRFEPLGNVVIQAWAHGLPVVAANSQGPGALIRDGEDGFLIPIDDADALAERTKTVLADPALRARLIQAGHARVEAEFSEAAVVEEWHHLFSRMGEA